MRTIGVVTVARSDYYILRPILRAIQKEPMLNLRLIVGGMHLSPEFGHTADAVERDGFEIAERVEMLLSSDTALGTAKSIGLGVIGFAEAYVRVRPDILLVLGDRFEMHAAALAALPFGIPVAHIHGGERTEGAIDDALRHGITKMAHLHFTATEEYAARVRQMGEEAWRVKVSGAPSLESLGEIRLLDSAELETRLGFPVRKDMLLVTFHPVTLAVDRTSAKVDALLDALRRSRRQIIFTLPNADAGGRTVAAAIRQFAESNRDAYVVDNMGTQAYFSSMKAAAAMVGNSSSGIIEAASFALPVVNVGARQAGRTRAGNVIDVRDDEDAEAIAHAIDVATSREFRESLRGMVNPYDHGSAAATILSTLSTVAIDEGLLMKRFADA